MGFDEQPNYNPVVTVADTPNYAPAPGYDMNVTGAYPPSPYGEQPQILYTPQPVYAQPYATNINQNQPGYGEAILVVSSTSQNNIALGFILGCFCGLFGLCCVLLVDDKNSYLKGWAIAFVILVVVGFILGFMSVVLG